jgi:hypothetical protein
MLHELHEGRYVGLARIDQRFNDLVGTTSGRGVGAVTTDVYKDMVMLLPQGRHWADRWNFSYANQTR